MSAEIEKIKSKHVLDRLSSKEELQDWIYTYLDMKFPMDTVYPGSTHAPVDAMWRIYELYLTGESESVPQVTMLASRDSYKTLAASAIIVLLMVHFRLQLATAGAIKAQSDKMIQYISGHFRKIDAYLIEKGWEKISESKSRTDWLDENGGLCFVRVVVATVAGMNSEHVPFLAIDEVDVVQDPRALEEAKMIPCVYKNSLGEKFFPLTVYLSTRKYAGGMMEKTLKNTIKAGGEILKWNILDVTERITREEARVDEPKVLRYISRELPLRNLSVEQFEELNDESKNKYEAFEAYAGIAEHPMLSVMKNTLVDRQQDNVDHLYKPLTAVHNNFKQTSPEMGEAQLLCNKPSSSGLVYPRFDGDENAMTINEAYGYLSGEPVEGEKTLEELVQYMHNLGIEFYGAADWGSTDETALGVFAKITGGKSWLIDLIAAPGMEIPEIVVKVRDLTEIYKVKRWFCDSNYPAYIKLLRKTDTALGKIPAIGVKKGAESVIDGITSVQSKIVDANNNRHFKVIKTRNTERVFESFETYKWKLDGKGEPIDRTPEHGKDGTSDIMDMIRYYFYSMFGRGSKVLFSYSSENTGGRPANLQHKINELTGKRGEKVKKNGKRKGIVWDI
jgi:hypothetical protein